MTTDALDIDLIAPSGTLRLTPVERIRGHGPLSRDIRGRVVPGHAGAILEAQRVVRRTIILEPRYWGSTAQALRDLIRTLSAAVDDGELRLRWTWPDGSQRDLYCYFEEAPFGQHFPSVVAPLRFQALDPYFYDTSETIATFDLTSADNPLLKDPFFPVVLDPSGSYNVSAANVGKEVWPIWTLTGPFDSGASLRHPSTGQSLTLTASIGAGETVVVDTRVGVKTATDASGSNVAWTGTMWPLPAGTSQARLSASGITASSEAELRWTARHEVP